jgi:tRNA A37 threonylcarbamoyladenosine dehydratase
VIDAVDSLKHKTLLILNASASKAKFFCSLGAALKVDPRRIKVAEFWSVRGCPLGAALRKRMKKAGTLPSSRFLCVYDDEVLPNRGASENCLAEESSFGKAQVNGSLVHITSMFGMTLAGLVVEDIYKAVVK